MNNQFITGNYNGQDKSITVWYRDEKGDKDCLKIVGFSPHFFVSENAHIPDIDRFLETLPCDTQGLFGEKLVRLNVSDPRSVSTVSGRSGRNDGLRDYFDKHWEADVRFIDRFLTNTRVFGGFTFPTGRKVVSWEDIKPIDFTLNPLVSYWDIEVATRTRFPNPLRPDQKIISSSVWDNKYKKYITFMLDPTYKPRKILGDWIKIYCEDEKDVISLTQDYFNRVKPDVITGWNIQFDVGYYQARARRLKLFTDLRFACVFDLAGGYKFLHKPLGNRLKDVVIEEGIAEEVVSEEFHIEFWERPETREKFMLYNKKDVEYCVLLDTGFTDIRTGEYKQYDITKFYWDLKNFVGKEDMTHMTHGMVIDLLLLRKAHGKYILPSRPPKDQRKESFRAAVVFEPPEGVFGAQDPYDGSVDPNEIGVAVLDMSRYYPNIVKAYYKKKLRFSPDSDENLFPELIDDLMELRETYEELMARYDPKSQEHRDARRKRDVVKSPLLSGVWGYIGWGGSRVFDKEKAEFIAGKAREGLELAKSKSEDLGYPILYGDTDSIMPKVELTNVDYLVDKLNVVFDDYCTKEGIPSLLKIKMDKFYRKAFWIEAEGKGRAAKKRYMGHCVKDEGRNVDYIDTKGFELIRGDSSKVTRRLQADTGDAILRKGTKGLVERIQKLVKDMREGVFSLDDIAITKQLHKKISEPSVDYYRGARYGNKYLGFDIRPGDMIKMIYVHRVKGFPLTDVVCYLDREKLPPVDVNWSKMIDRTVRRKVERMLHIANLSWELVDGFKPLETFFG